MSLCMAHLQEHQLSLSWPQGMTSYKIPIYLIPSQQLSSGSLRAEKPWSQGWPSPPQMSSTYYCWKPLRSSCFRNPVDNSGKINKIWNQNQHMQLFGSAASSYVLPPVCYSPLQWKCTVFKWFWYDLPVNHVTWSPVGSSELILIWPQAPIELQVWISVKVIKHHPQNTQILAQYTTDLVMNPSWPPPPYSSSTLVFNAQLHKSEMYVVLWKRINLLGDIIPTKSYYQSLVQGCIVLRRHLQMNSVSTGAITWFPQVAQRRRLSVSIQTLEHPILATTTDNIKKCNIHKVAWKDCVGHQGKLSCEQDSVVLEGVTWRDNTSIPEGSQDLALVAPL